MEIKIEDRIVKSKVNIKNYKFNIKKALINKCRPRTMYGSGNIGRKKVNRKSIPLLYIGKFLK
jgi:hypothetical protein